MKAARDVINAYKNRTRTAGGEVVKDWRDLLPAGSKWQPGDPGNPACKTCEGRGFVRLELPLGHPDFGRIFLCDCCANKAKDI